MYILRPTQKYTCDLKSTQLLPKKIKIELYIVREKQKKTFTYGAQLLIIKQVLTSQQQTLAR